MESLSATQNSQEKQRTTVAEPAAPALLAAMSVRIFAYGGPQGKLRPLAWQPEAAVTRMFQTLVEDGQGRVTQISEAALVAHFENPVHALAVARSLQQKLLTFHREASTEQLVAAAIVHGWKLPVSKPCSVDSPTEEVTPPTVLAEPSPAQILATEAIYDAARSMPGFEFNAIPVRGPGETGTAENFYELLWADASTYANLRRAIQDAGLNTPGKSRYEIRSELGRGAMGIVYKAHDRLIGRTVALKTITVDRSARDHDSLVERLKQEAKAAGCLDHPNIITIYDVGQEGDRIYLSMQFVEGVTLSSLLTDGKLPPLPSLLAFAGQICSAVGYAHKHGVIHRDLKPANLMLTSQNTIKVLDFGIAKLGDTGLTQAGMVIGTPTYMAPEQAVGKNIDHRSDIFALGAVFYELFTRERPFKGEITTIFYKLIHEDPTPPSVINPALPSGLDAIIRKALAKDPQQRFQTCEEMQQALAEQAALLGNSVGTVSAISRPVVAAKPQAQPAVTVVKPEIVGSRRSGKAKAWAYVAVIACIIAAGTVLGLRLARVKAAIWAFKHPEQTAVVLNNDSRNNASSPAAPASEQGAAPAKSAPSDTATQAASVAAGTENASVNPQPFQTADVAGRDRVLPLPGDANSSDAGKALPVQSAAVQPAVSGPANTAKLKPVSATGAGAATSDSSLPNYGADRANREPVDASAKLRRRDRLFADSEADTAINADGFKRSDVPDLVRRADAAAGHGDYVTARYEYRLVLRLDKQNAAARAGLVRVLEAQKER
jgi:protein kinase-like protein